MKKFILAAALLVFTPLAYAAPLPAAHLNVDVYCAHYARLVVKAMEARNIGMTQQLAYHAIRGGSTQHSFNRQGTKAIINMVYSQMPDISVQSTRNAKGFDNSIRGGCIHNLTHHK